MERNKRENDIHLQVRQFGLVFHVWDFFVVDCEDLDWVVLNRDRFDQSFWNGNVHG